MGEPERMPRYDHGGRGAFLPKGRPRGDRGAGGDTPDDDLPDNGGPDISGDVITRALSVAPFILVAALGLIAVISWVLLVVFGIGAGDPIWTWAAGKSAGEVLWQLVQAILIGLIPVAIVLVASWATVRGFGEESGRLFWTVTQLVWSLAAIGLVTVDRAKHEWIETLGLSATDWWFAFSVVAFAVIMSGVRLRRRQASGGRRS